MSAPAAPCASETSHPPLRSRGAVFSRIAAGAWRMADWGLTPQQRLRWISACLELGVSTFDHADIYGGYSAEALFGEALALAPGLRSRMQLVGKCGIKLVHPERPSHAIKHYDSSPAHVRASVEASLRALGTDHLDVLLVHRPDALMDASALARCFEDLRAAGKVRHFGVSNFSPSQWALLNQHLPLVTNQIEFSPLQLAPLGNGCLDQAQAEGFSPMVWSPLAGGRLFTGQDPAAQRVRALLQTLAKEHQSSPEAVAIAWLLRHPARLVPVLGSQRPEAYAQAVAALDLALSASDWYRLLEAATGLPVE